MTIAIGADPIGIDDVVAVARRKAEVQLGEAAAARMLKAQAVLQDWLKADRPVYGLTRGLGNQASREVPAEERSRFSEAMLKARASGAGDPLPDEVVRAALFVRAATLARGGAGVRPKVVEAQLAMLARGVTPLVPSIGSIGTSDLMLCANMALPLIGLGRATHEGAVMSGAEAMQRAGLAPLALTEKEGLALCSSNAVSIGFGALALADARDLMGLADATLAMAYEAFVGNPSPFDPRIAAAHPAAGQVEAARRLRALLSGSAVLQPGVPRRIQDPISLRCATHLHGTALTALGWAQEAVEIELNAAADNPLILIEESEILSSGNFHTGAMALAFDAVRLALVQVGSAASQRIARLLDPDLSGLEGRLTKGSVTRSGVALLALVAHTLDREQRDAAAPVLADDVTPFGVEDQAPFTLLSVRRLGVQVDLIRGILACELIVAAQALDVRPLEPSAPAVRALRGVVREHVSFLDEDRSTTEDVETLSAALKSGDALRQVQAAMHTG